MTELRVVELLFLVFSVYLYCALSKERKRVRILRHFITQGVHLSVDTACRIAQEEDREAASLAALKMATLKFCIFDGIFTALEIDSSLDRFVKRDRKLFRDRHWWQGSQDWILYSELYGFVSSRWREVSRSSAAR